MDLNLLGSDQTKVVGINPKNLIKLVYKVFIPNVFKQVNVHFQGNLELYHYKLHKKKQSYWHQVFGASTNTNVKIIPVLAK